MCTIFMKCWYKTVAFIVIISREWRRCSAQPIFFRRRYISLIKFSHHRNSVANERDIFRF